VLNLSPFSSGRGPIPAPLLCSALLAPGVQTFSTHQPNNARHCHRPTLLLPVAFATNLEVDHLHFAGNLTILSISSPPQILRYSFPPALSLSLSLFWFYLPNARGGLSLTDSQVKVPFRRPMQCNLIHSPPIWVTELYYFSPSPFFQMRTKSHVHKHCRFRPFAHSLALATHIVP
jgi:hypothetical protein